MVIKQYTGNRRQYLPLLLEADPSEEMLNRYLDQGFFLVAEENGAVAGVACVVPVENLFQGLGGWELKNISVAEPFQRRGVGSALIAASQENIPRGGRVLGRHGGRQRCCFGLLPAQRLWGFPRSKRLFY